MSTIFDEAYQVLLENRSARKAEEFVMQKMDYKKRLTARKMVGHAIAMNENNETVAGQPASHG